jgi:anaerobic selenocysteine-containing dehydrogenase
MSIARTVCPLDCPDRCSLEVRLEEGRAVSIDGNRTNPLTEGYICAKVRRFADRAYGPDRLRRPMKRIGAKGEGRFEPIAWDEAIDAIVDRFQAVRRESGGEAILPFNYGGSNGLLTQGAGDQRLFRGLGASRLERTVCAAPTGVAAQALYGKMASVDFSDFEAARCIIIWGANPRHSNIHLMPHLKRARANGCRVALIDPRRTLGPEWIDRHLAVYPGSDAAVALAMIAHLETIGRIDRDFLAAHATGAERLLERAREWTLERAAAFARVEAREIAAIAEEYSTATPSLVRCGWGLERNRNGVSAAAAVLALPAMAGKFAVQGGGYAMSAQSVYGVDGERLATLPEAPTRIINMNRLGRALLEESDPPIRALFVYNANPVVTIPDQNRVRRGLCRDDLFTVVFDQVMTDTALYADILLPATTFLEHTELNISYGTYAVQLGEPVIAPVGESRPNEEVFTLLAGRLGVGGDHPEGERLIAEALASIGGPLAGAGGREGRPDGAERLTRLRRDGILPFDFPGPRPVQFATAFPRTGDRKVHLWPAALGPEPYAVLELPRAERYPLALISPATHRTISSSLAEYGFSQGYVEMHPDDAAARGLEDRQRVRVYNDLGEVQVPLRLNEGLRPGVVNIPKGLWNRHTMNGAVSTALVPDSLSEIANGACFNDARVEVGGITG